MTHPRPLAPATLVVDYGGTLTEASAAERAGAHTTIAHVSHLPDLLAGPRR